MALVIRREESLVRAGYDPASFREPAFCVVIGREHKDKLSYCTSESSQSDPVL